MIMSVQGARKINFFACEAFLYRVTGEFECEVWVKEPSALKVPYGQSKKEVLEINLKKTPIEVANLDDVEIDDFITEGGLTRLGPRYPGAARSEEAHASEASIWLSEAKFKDAKERLLSSQSHSTPQAGTLDYQWQTILSIDDPSTMNGIRRYAGYRARRVAMDVQGRRALKVWNALANPTSESQAQDVILDITDKELCDKDSSAKFDQDGDEGALFLEWQYANSRNLLSPKLPIGYGMGSFPSVFQAQLPKLPLVVHSQPYPEDYRQRMAAAVARRRGTAPR
jgi:hypothetical protein